MYKSFNGARMNSDEKQYKSSYSKRGRGGVSSSRGGRQNYNQPYYNGRNTKQPYNTYKKKTDKPYDNSHEEYKKTYNSDQIFKNEEYLNHIKIITESLSEPYKVNCEDFETEFNEKLKKYNEDKEFKEMIQESVKEKNKTFKFDEEFENSIFRPHLIMPDAGDFITAFPIRYDTLYSKIIKRNKTDNGLNDDSTIIDYSNLNFITVNNCLKDIKTLLNILPFKIIGLKETVSYYNELLNKIYIKCSEYIHYIKEYVDNHNKTDEEIHTNILNLFNIIYDYIMLPTFPVNKSEGFSFNISTMYILKLYKQIENNDDIKYIYSNIDKKYKFSFYEIIYNLIKHPNFTYAIQNYCSFELLEKIYNEKPELISGVISKEKYNKLFVELYGKELEDYSDIEQEFYDKLNDIDIDKQKIKKDKYKIYNINPGEKVLRYCIFVLINIIESYNYKIITDTEYEKITGIMYDNIFSIIDSYYDEEDKYYIYGIISKLFMEYIYIYYINSTTNKYLHYDNYIDIVKNINEFIDYIKNFKINDEYKKNITELILSINELQKIYDMNTNESYIIKCIKSIKETKTENCTDEYNNIISYNLSFMIKEMKNIINKINDLYNIIYTDTVEYFNSCTSNKEYMIMIFDDTSKYKKRAIIRQNEFVQEYIKNKYKFDIEVLKNDERYCDMTNNEIYNEYIIRAANYLTSEDLYILYNDIDMDNKIDIIESINPDDYEDQEFKTFCENYMNILYCINDIIKNNDSIMTKIKGFDSINNYLVENIDIIINNGKFNKFKCLYQFVHKMTDKFIKYYGCRNLMQKYYFVGSNIAVSDYIKNMINKSIITNINNDNYKEEIHNINEKLNDEEYLIAYVTRFNV